MLDTYVTSYTEVLKRYKYTIIIINKRRRKESNEKKTRRINKQYLSKPHT